MKKTFLLLILFISSVIITQAQGFGIGVITGVNFAGAQARMDGQSDYSDLMTGFHGGLIAEYGFTEEIYMNAGAVFSQKGFREGKEYKLRINAADIHLNLAYKYPLGNLKFYLEIGPYAGIALSGKVKFNNLEGPLSFGKDPGKAQRVEGGIQLGAGIEYKGLRLGGGYQIGLTNIINSPPLRVTNSTFSISLGYIFNRANSVAYFDPTAE